MNIKKIVPILFSALFLFSVMAFTVSAEQTNMEIVIPKFDKQPTFDGVISEDEWGPKTLRMVTEGAATHNSTEIGYNEQYGLKNIFYYYVVEGISDSLAYDLWLRWDDQYLYVAAVVDDPDPFSLPRGGDDIWCGDSMQIRIDEKGPSAKMLQYYPNFNYKTDDFMGARFKTPWSSYTEVFNGYLGLVKGNTPTIWRAGKDYGYGWNLANDGALVGINCEEHSDNTCTITYEGAIPWSAVNALLVPQAGDVYGMCVSVSSAKEDEVNATLIWGHGNYGMQPSATRGGSQAVVLSDDVVSSSDEPAESENPDDSVDITFEDLLEGMTEEEIEAVYKDLEELGLTEDDIMELLTGKIDIDDLFPVEETDESLGTEEVTEAEETKELEQTETTNETTAADLSAEDDDADSDDDSKSEKKPGEPKFLAKNAVLIICIFFGAIVVIATVIIILKTTKKK